MNSYIVYLFILIPTLIYTQENQENAVLDLHPLVTIENIVLTNQSTKNIVYPAEDNPYKIDVRCRVPTKEVKASKHLDNITLTCGFPDGVQTYTVRSWSAIFVLELVNQGAVVCTCAASFTSGLYRPSTVFTLNYTASSFFPPPEAPQITYGKEPLPDEYHLKVRFQKGSPPPIINLTCVVPGGSPLVSNITLYCGFRRNTKSTSKVQIIIRPHRAISNRRCVCSAMHVTGLYNKTSSFRLTVFNEDLPNR